MGCDQGSHGYPPGNEYISHLCKKIIIFKSTCGKGYVSSQEGIYIYTIIYICVEEKTLHDYMTSSAYLPPSKHTPSFPNISDWFSPPCAFGDEHSAASAAVGFAAARVVPRSHGGPGPPAGTDGQAAPGISTGMSCWYLVTGYNPYISRLVISPLSGL